MNGPLYRFFTDDHRRLKDLLNRAAANPAAIDVSAYKGIKWGQSTLGGAGDARLFFNRPA
jgi:hypothetical protein